MIWALVIDLGTHDQLTEGLKVKPIPSSAGCLSRKQRCVGSSFCEPAVRRSEFSSQVRESPWADPEVLSTYHSVLMTMYFASKRWRKNYKLVCKAYFSSLSAFSFSAQFGMIFCFSAFIPLIKVPEAGSMGVWAGMFGAESLALIFYTVLKSIHSLTLYSGGQCLALVGSPRAIGFWVSWETGGSCPPISPSRDQSPFHLFLSSLLHLFTQSLFLSNEFHAEKKIHEEDFAVQRLKYPFLPSTPFQRCPLKLEEKVHK